ncbi:uncharacterized protein METZ01_LOCUS147455 [marine metagenome]|uniref:Uncharacterized protein n=1 Tax=marine metagenome TaxID=408172 RepID=A0A382A047_9ZZZZ
MILVGRYFMLFTLLVIRKENTNTRNSLCQLLFRSLKLCKKFYEFYLFQNDDLR